MQTVAAKELKSKGKFTIPDLVTLNVTKQPATKAGKRKMNGKVVMVKAKPARKVVKCFPTATLKKRVADKTSH